MLIKIPIKTKNVALIISSYIFFTLLLATIFVMNEERKWIEWSNKLVAKTTSHKGVNNLIGLYSSVLCDKNKFKYCQIKIIKRDSEKILAQNPSYNFPNIWPNKFTHSFVPIQISDKILVEITFSYNFLYVFQYFIYSSFISMAVIFVLIIIYLKKMELINLQRIELLKKENENLKIVEKFETIASQVSHDICSPLTVMKILLKEKIISENNKNILIDCTNRIEKISNGLLADRRKALKGWGSKEDIGTLKIKDTVKGLMAKKRIELSEKKHLVIKENYTAENILILGNELQFSRLISNLVNNAAEAMNYCGTICVSTYKNKVIILDEGSGIPREVIDSLFNNRKIESSKITGNGLGLKDAYEKVKSWNGEFEIKSESRGTELTLIFNEV